MGHCQICERTRHDHDSPELGAGLRQLERSIQEKEREVRAPDNLTELRHQAQALRPAKIQRQESQRQRENYQENSAAIIYLQTGPSQQ